MKAGPLNGAEERTRIKQTRVIYETACALAESTTLVEAAPRMLEAICEALGWEYGALWSVDRAAARLRCLATWHPPSLPFDDFAAISRQTEFASGIGLPGRVWASGKPAWIPDVVHDSNFPARAVRRPRGAARGVRLSGARRRRGHRRDGVLQPGDPRARRRAARDADDRRRARSACSSNGSGPRRSWIGSSRCRWTCCASRTSTGTSSA